MRPIREQEDQEYRQGQTDVIFRFSTNGVMVIG